MSCRVSEDDLGAEFTDCCPGMGLNGDVSVFSQVLKVEVALNGVGVARPKGPCLLGGLRACPPRKV